LPISGIGQEAKKPSRGQLLGGKVCRASDALLELQRQKAKFRTKKAHPREAERSESDTTFLEVLSTHLHKARRRKLTSRINSFRVFSRLTV
jgi:hypothetical protein